MRIFISGSFLQVTTNYGTPLARTITLHDRGADVAAIVYTFGKSVGDYPNAGVTGFEIEIANENAAGELHQILKELSS